MRDLVRNPICFAASFAVVVGFSLMCTTDDVAEQRIDLFPHLDGQENACLI